MKTESSLIGAIGALALLGLAALWSASAGFALSMGKGADYFAVRQFAFLAFSAGLFFAAAKIPLTVLRDKMWLVMPLALAFLALPLIPGIGDNRNGASRWIDLGVTTFQPSEIWKPVVIVYLAHMLDKNKAEIRRSESAVFAPSLLAGFGSLIIFLQSDFSTSMIIAIAAVSVMFIAGVRFRFFAAVLTAILPLAGLMVLTSEYRLKRIIGFLVPGYDPHGLSYQVQGSLKAIGSGGILGKGLGLGTRKIASIPEVQSDFVFAAFVEETGIIGVAVVFALWAFIGFTVYRAVRERDDFYGFAAIGLFGMLALQFLANVAVASGFVPATGLALPFFSAGGSSLIATAISCGIMYNAATFRGFEAVSLAGGIGAPREVGNV